MLDKVIPPLRRILGGLQLQSRDLLEYAVALVISSIDEEHFVSSNGQTSCKGPATWARAHDHVVIDWVYRSGPLVGGPVRGTGVKVSCG